MRRTGLPRKRREVEADGERFDKGLLANDIPQYIDFFTTVILPFGRII
jgi:hypothetical protein